MASAYDQLFPPRTTAERDAWERKVEAKHKRQRAAQVRYHALPDCPVCGGKIQNGRCEGNGVIMCGLVRIK